MDRAIGILLVISAAFWPLAILVVRLRCRFVTHCSLRFSLWRVRRLLIAKVGLPRGLADRWSVWGNWLRGFRAAAIIAQPV
jgi:hypothetical protein